MSKSDNDEEQLLGWLASVRKGIRIEQRTIFGAAVVYIAIYALQLWANSVYSEAQAESRYSDKILEGLRQGKDPGDAGAGLSADAKPEALAGLRASNDRLEALSRRLLLVKWITFATMVAGLALPVYWARGMFLLSSRTGGFLFPLSDSKRRALRWGAAISLMAIAFRITLLVLREKPLMAVLLTDGLLMGAGLALQIGHESVLRNAARTMDNEWLESRTTQVLRQIFFVPIGLALLVLGAELLKIEALRELVSWVFWIGTGLMLGRFSGLLRKFDDSLGEVVGSR